MIARQTAIVIFRLRATFDWLLSLPRIIYWRWLGAQIGSGTTLRRIDMTWPHQVSIGANCLLEAGILFKFDGPWRSGPSILLRDRVFLGRGCEFNIQKGIEIGENGLIGSGCKFIDHDHGTVINIPMNTQACSRCAPIKIGADVWLGDNVIVLSGITIGEGAVIGAGAVVSHSVPSNEIWAGVPARRIGIREPQLLNE